jgi:IstB-like ATP binding protein
LAVALGRAAIREGYSALLAPALVAGLVKAHAEGRLEVRLGFYSKPKLLIIETYPDCMRIRRGTRHSGRSRTAIPPRRLDESSLRVSFTCSLS